MAVNVDLVDKSGAWYSYNGERIGQGRENVKNYMKDHPEMVSELLVKVRDAYGIGDGSTIEQTENAVETEQETLDLE